MLEHVIVDVHPVAAKEAVVVVAAAAAAVAVTDAKAENAGAAVEADVAVDSGEGDGEGEGEGSLTAEEELYIAGVGSDENAENLSQADADNASLPNPPSLIVRGKAILLAQEGYPVQKAVAPESRPASAVGGKAHLKGKALLFDKLRKASRTSALSHLANAKKGSGKTSPLLKNRRWPSTSDAQNGRWKTESQSQFVYRKAPLQLL
jgi:hypothetical protein